MTDRRKPYRLPLGGNRGSTTLLLTEEHAAQSYPMATLVTDEDTEAPVTEGETSTGEGAGADTPAGGEKQAGKPNKAAEPGGDKAL